MFNFFTLHIELGNDGMKDGPDVAKALRETADKIELELVARGSIYDDNGNKVGDFGAGNDFGS